MRKRAVLAMLLGAAVILPEMWGGGAARAADAGAGTSAAAENPFVQDLRRRLNSEDAAEREGAKRELADIAKVWQQADLLKQMGEMTTDKDMQGLIEQRLGELKAKQALADLAHLPPISLKVSGATLGELVTALNEALNPAVRLTATRSAMGQWTLEAKDQPFWEVFAALTEQRPLSLGGSGGQIVVSPTGTAIRRYAVDGPAMAYVGAINYSRSIGLQGPQGKEEASRWSLTAAVTVAVDPRVRVNRFENVRLTAAVDDAGHRLVRPGGASGNSYGAGANQATAQFSLALPEKPGKTMALTCEAELQVQATEFTASIEDVENNVDKAVTLGGGTIRVTRFAMGGGRTGQAQVNVTAPGGPAATGPARTYTLTDGTGRTVWAGQNAGSFTMSIGSAGSGPYKLEIRMPGKTAEIPVRFELTDIPLPGE